ncbi:hypothetical protein CcaverHIS002_0105780 [Cutaneotrichosporon cavernicola]|uniref:DNA polymerase n=1 Tax=Cutaneotrichosporon cavernicola TaxID=279322 RepID=A0AA48I6B4_9TREE|nr:uncharacterized protein CcaverHIS019_0105730 [Cutaneotrichosporon cavernicola]BEI80049.1 hypothetical protein CcaverHIS002_0105780 [Cutaneotrichosporon cavernicola]BEI87855.1 hypothetical protein CcaverHIS019_0105730 [Cutaneotrichosporon cavernicola]BEI95629.1 hypothetical protein CcaverHIS631_0105780 [Cutaneotrichosporon cavernicola]BEJ03404.1 hypothetical protein CcaverHIS641_0105790 [Cutaneotrichosporon cavernicola]
MFPAQAWKRATYIRSWPAARQALSWTMAASTSSQPDPTNARHDVEAPREVASDSARSPSRQAQPSISFFSGNQPKARKPNSRQLCPALHSIQTTHSDYKDMLIPSRLLMDALTVPMNSRGGPIMVRPNGRDFTNAEEREDPDVRITPVTLSQRLLKDGDRLLTLGEIEGAVGAGNNFVWKTIWALLQKFKSTGLESLTEEQISRELFSRLPSLGTNKAHALAYSGHRTLDDLMGSDRVKAKTKNFIQLLQVQDRAIPRAEVDEFRERLQNALAGSVPKYRFEIVGPYRRGSAYTQSIKVLVWHTDFERHGQDDSGINQLYHRLQQNGLINLEDMIQGGPNSPGQHTTLQCLSSLDKDRPERFLDIRIVPTESVPYRIFYDTGSSWLVSHMRLEAKKRGLELWARGLYPLGQPRPAQTAILVDNERELFELLDVPWIEPTQRGPKGVNVMLPKLRAWSSASRPSPDYLNRVLSQATVVKPGRMHPTNVPEIVAASRLPLPKARTRDVPAFPAIDIGGSTTDIDMIQRRAAASLSRSRFEKEELKRVERQQREGAEA